MRVPNLSRFTLGAGRCGSEIDSRPERERASERAGTFDRERVDLSGWGPGPRGAPASPPSVLIPAPAVSRAQSVPRRAVLCLVGVLFGARARDFGFAMAAPAACTRFSDNYDLREELGK